MKEETSMALLLPFPVGRASRLGTGVDRVKLKVRSVPLPRPFVSIVVGPATDVCVSVCPRVTVLSLP